MMLLVLLFVPAALAAEKATDHSVIAEKAENTIDREIFLLLKNIQKEVGDCLFRTKMSGYNARLNVGIMMALSNKTEQQRFCCECTTAIHIPVFKDRYYRRVLLGHNQPNTYKIAQRLLKDYTFAQNRDIVEVGCAQERFGLHSVFGLDKKVYCVFRPYRPGNDRGPIREGLGRRMLGTLRHI
ncbi:unnamed protein product [Cylicocyclus nassatus]|uniref:Uncharacterized protein n=1 Tax=Cylicocyclus nassatus TaxID=53992 RepID=A0AA36H3P3_CYLNA|nr:unnamed protein product [Cylicocyclus nassatus]